MLKFLNVQHDIHNIENELTDIFYMCDYPPYFPNISHEINVAFGIWEFEGDLPFLYKNIFNQFDAVFTPSEWVTERFKKNLKVKCDTIPLGIDTEEFKPFGETYDFGLPDKKILLWVGGTDKRHGLEEAIQIGNMLSDEYHLICKTSVHYPDVKNDSGKVTILRKDFKSLAPLYRSAYALLHTAKGVGYSLPVLESLSCGTPVVTSDLPVLQQFDSDLFVKVSGEFKDFKHHIHDDGIFQWFEYDPIGFLEAIEKVKKLPKQKENWNENYTWEKAAKILMEKLLYYANEKI